MAWNNLTPPGDDDSSNSGDTRSGGGSMGLPPISMGSSSSHLSDVTEILINYNERFKTSDQALYRDSLVDMMMSILIAKTKPNVRLEGSAGVGKTKVVEELARLIANKSDKIPSQLKNTTIWELPLSNLVAGGGIVGEIESRVTNLVDWASDRKNDAIIFIDEIHLLNSRSETYNKISQILKPALARGDIRVIGATTGQEGRALDDDPAFARRFTRLVVNQLSLEEAAEIIRNVAVNYSAHYEHKVGFDPALAARLVMIADDNSTEASRRPDNALTLLDRAMADTIITYSHQIHQAKEDNDQVTLSILQQMLPLPITEGKLKTVATKLSSGLSTHKEYDEKELILALELIRGQEDAIDDVIETISRMSLGVFPKKTPTVLMFAGPSGCGKTQVGKLMADALTGQKPIMLNMTEYANSHDASKLIGSGPGYVGSDSNRELPFDQLESNPHQLIILDEMEKAHKDIHRLFLPIFDEGWMRMASGKIIDFSKATFIITTNAAKDQFAGKPQMGFTANNGSVALTRDQIAKALEEAFDPEFLGRISQLLAFKAISKEIYQEIFTLDYEREYHRILDANPQHAVALSFPLDTDVIEKIVATTYVPSLGARPAKRAVKAFIEDTLLGKL